MSGILKNIEKTKKYEIEKYISEKLTVTAEDRLKLIQDILLNKESIKQQCLSIFYELNARVLGKEAINKSYVTPVKGVKYLSVDAYIKKLVDFNKNIQLDTHAVDLNKLKLSEKTLISQSSDYSLTLLKNAVAEVVNKRITSNQTDKKVKNPLHVKGSVFMQKNNAEGQNVLLSAVSPNKIEEYVDLVFSNNSDQKVADVVIAIMLANEDVKELQDVCRVAYNYKVNEGLSYGVKQIEEGYKLVNKLLPDVALSKDDYIENKQQYDKFITVLKNFNIKQEIVDDKTVYSISSKLNKETPADINTVGDYKENNIKLEALKSSIQKENEKLEAWLGEFKDFEQLHLGNVVQNTKSQINNIIEENNAKLYDIDDISLNHKQISNLEVNVLEKTVHLTGDQFNDVLSFVKEYGGLKNKVNELVSDGSFKEIGQFKEKNNKYESSVIKTDSIEVLNNIIDNSGDWKNKVNQLYDAYEYALNDIISNPSEANSIIAKYDQQIQQCSNDVENIIEKVSEYKHAKENYVDDVALYFNNTITNDHKLNKQTVNNLMKVPGVKSLVADIKTAKMLVNQVKADTANKFSQTLINVSEANLYKVDKNNLYDQIAYFENAVKNDDGQIIYDNKFDVVKFDGKSVTLSDLKQNLMDRYNQIQNKLDSSENEAENVLSLVADVIASEIQTINLESLNNDASNKCGSLINILECKEFANKKVNELKDNQLQLEKTSADLEQVKLANKKTSAQFEAFRQISDKAINLLNAASGQTQVKLLLPENVDNSRYDIVAVNPQSVTPTAEPQETVNVVENVVEQPAEIQNQENVTDEKYQEVLNSVNEINNKINNLEDSIKSIVNQNNHITSAENKQIIDLLGETLKMYGAEVVKAVERIEKVVDTQQETLEKVLQQKPATQTTVQNSEEAPKEAENKTITQAEIKKEFGQNGTMHGLLFFGDGEKDVKQTDDIEEWIKNNTDKLDKVTGLMLNGGSVVKTGVLKAFNNAEYVGLDRGVKAVEKQAFEGMSSLKGVAFFDNVKKDMQGLSVCDIDNDAFKGANKNLQISFIAQGNNGVNYGRRLANPEFFMKYYNNELVSGTAKNQEKTQKEVENAQAKVQDVNRKKLKQTRKQIALLPKTKTGSLLHWVARKPILSAFLFSCVGLVGFAAVTSVFFPAALSALGSSFTLMGGSIAFIAASTMLIGSLFKQVTKGVSKRYRLMFKDAKIEKLSRKVIKDMKKGESQLDIATNAKQQQLDDIFEEQLNTNKIDASKSLKPILKSRSAVYNKGIKKYNKNHKAVEKHLKALEKAERSRDKIISKFAKEKEVNELNDVKGYINTIKVKNQEMNARKREIIGEKTANNDLLNGGDLYRNYSKSMNTNDSKEQRLEKLRSAINAYSGINKHNIEVKAPSVRNRIKAYKNFKDAEGLTFDDASDFNEQPKETKSKEFTLDKDGRF